MSSLGMTGLACVQHSLGWVLAELGMCWAEYGLC